MKYRLVITVLLISLLSLSSSASPRVELLGARLSSQDEMTRLVLDTSGPVVEHNIFTLDSPDRLVLDLAGIGLAGSLRQPTASNPLLARIRSGERPGESLRIVLDLKRKVRVKSFCLQPDGRHGYRLVVDLTPKSELEARQDALAAASRDLSDHPSVKQRSVKLKARDVVIAIDAGHGGKDPGAIGAHGTREKDVTLSIARNLARLVDKEPGMRAAMIRDSDRFVILGERIRIARKHRADLFVSIHADAFRDRSVRGSSVFTLSERGATSEAAKWLAKKENEVDLLAGIDLGKSNQEVAGVLMNMTQNMTMEHSLLAAKPVLEQLGHLGKMHQSRIQSAGFAVLKAPDIPSMLVETAFISNPEEEKRLRTPGFQQKVAEAILSGIKHYFNSHPPPQTLFAMKNGGRSNVVRHIIEPGDTLLDIARDYQVSLPSLRSLNQLNGDHIRVGQVLQIPEG
ncbi:MULTISPECIES: N-acetylmuramoyl-L-alanine amidase [Thiorhodovibrio]|uniref:N-acetylmuramoyl-L-alanine amidase n=1 Tax=Thiorhodovibrio TaxID=61593 RepID=UPI0019149259|nr:MULTISPECIES: N-acetylmuramoyl-L-alanine amidase [Thiorhodovibrio]MBK5969548.1 N-acetylmuramoyl-L-alanine amidase [Thiorhodovibrio winogradskyi]WPL13953.1 N-acetylmuramoyl-L-alanine amidase AmiC precursor [Thiorhodovibrio litoralis]